jgi:hypothetical protein
VEHLKKEMFVDILNDWRRLLLLKEERFSLSDIFALSPKDLRELQTFPRREIYEAYRRVKFGIYGRTC